MKDRVRQASAARPVEEAKDAASHAFPAPAGTPEMPLDFANVGGPKNQSRQMSSSRS